MVWQTTSIDGSHSSKAAVGLRARSYQRFISINDTYKSDGLSTFYANNTASQSSGFAEYWLINPTIINYGTATTSYALEYSNAGSTRTDRFNLIGGTLTKGPNATATTVFNNSGGGSWETEFFYDKSPVLGTTSYGSTLVYNIPLTLPAVFMLEPFPSYKGDYLASSIGPFLTASDGKATATYLQVQRNGGPVGAQFYTLSDTYGERLKCSVWSTVGTPGMINSFDLDPYDGTFLARTPFHALSTALFGSTVTISGLSGVVKATAGVLSGSATTSDLTEGSNLYYTDARARAALSATSPVSYNNSTGVISMAAASTSVNGYLTSTDWNTFNNKEGAITAGTTAQYWRGDKTWQTLNQAAVAGLTTSSSPTFAGLTLTGYATLHADPTNALHAATKQYVDALATGLDFKASVRVVSLSNITLSGTQTIDGVSVVAGDRVLVAGQTTGADNGIYVVSASGWSRATDADTDAEVTAGMYTFVSEGTTYADSSWVLTTNDPITLGTTALVFVQFSGAGQITAGAGLTKTGNTLDVGTASSSRIVVNADNIDLATTAISAGDFNYLTIDAYGRATGGYLRTLTAPTYGITVTNGSGAAGNPTLALSNDLAALETLGSTGFAVRTNTDTWTQRTLTGTTNQVVITNGSGVSGNPTFSLPQSIATTSDVNFNTVTTASYVAANSLTGYAGITNYVSSGTSTILSQSVAGGQALVVADAATSQYTGFQTKTAGTLHWFFGQDNSTQSGSNVGGDWFMARYSDAGGYLGLAYSISRASGDTTFYGNFGIGIAPGVPLHIQDTGTDKGILLRSSGGGNSLRIGYISSDRPYLDSTAGQDMLFMIGGSGKLTISSALVSTNQAFTASGVITGSAGANITGQTYSTTGFLVNNYQSYKSKNAAGTAVDLFYLDSSNNFQFSCSSGAYYDWQINGTTKLRLNSTGLNVAGSGSATSAFQVGKGLNLASLSVDPNSTTNLFVSTYNYYSDTYQNLYLDQARLTIRPSGTGTTTGQYIYTSTGFGIGGDANYKFDIVGPGSNVDAMQIQKGSGEGGLRFSFANANHTSYIRTYEDNANSYMHFGVASGTSTNVSVMKLFGDRTVQLTGYTAGIVKSSSAGLLAVTTITGTSNRITVTNGDGASGAPTIDISSSYVGQNTITTLGTITTGTWNGTALATAYIAANAVTNAKLAQMATNTIKGNNTGGTADPTDLTVSQVKTMLSLNNVENTALSTWAGTSNITTYTRRVVITLADGQGTPASTGPYSAIKRIPYGYNNASVTWTVKRVWFRIENPSANTSTIQVKYSNGGAGQVFSGSNLQSAGLSITGVGVYENSTTSMSQSTLTSGQLIQVDVSALGSGQTGWSIEVELEG
jgi:hypothetical protein